MRSWRHFGFGLAALSLVFLLGGSALSPRPALASTEDAAIFYDELSQSGTWVDYGDYGPVWYPNATEEGWRPYVNGRWVPTEQGYVFESQEPWAATTYHYGNWMPTDEYGWVWVPGRTWYPSTVNWRTSPENTPEEAAYVGWAPVPPPNYQPSASYAPYGGYTAGSDPFAPFYIFVRAASFLLGFGQPYASAYNYNNCACLAPPAYMPVVYQRTIIINNYVAPGYYPAGYITRGFPVYNWGPPIPYVARWSRIPAGQINNYVRQVNIYNIHNVVPRREVFASRPWLQKVYPPAIVSQQPLGGVQRVTNLTQVRGNFVRPHLTPVVQGGPTWTAQIPKATITRVEKGRGLPGAGLPPRAVMPLSPQMQGQIQKLPPARQIHPVMPITRQPQGVVPAEKQPVQIQQQQFKQQQLQQEQLKRQQFQQQQMQQEKLKQQQLQQQQFKQQQLQQDQLKKQQFNQEQLKRQQFEQEKLKQQQFQQKQLQQQQLQQKQLQQQQLQQKQHQQQQLQQKQLQQQQLQQKQIQQQQLQQKQLQQQQIQQQQIQQKQLQQQQIQRQQIQQQHQIKQPVPQGAPQTKPQDNKKKGQEQQIR